MNIIANPLLSLERNPNQSNLVVYEDGAKAYYENTDNTIFTILDYCSVPQVASSVTGFLARKMGKTYAEAEALLHNMFEKELLIDADNLNEKLLHEKAQWIKHGWLETWHYHRRVYNHPFRDYSQAGAWGKDQAVMKEYASQELPPSIYKEYVEAEKFPLSRPSDDIVQKLPIRRANKSYGLSNDLLSVLMYLGAGEIGQMQLPVLGKSLLKTAPSGGARHPIETYLYNLNLEDLPKGVFHYSVQHHSLSLINDLPECFIPSDVFYYLGHKKGFKTKGIIVLTELFRRSMWRYREPRSLRAAIFDLGHVIGNLKFIVRSMGYDVVDSHALDEDFVAANLQITDDTEIPMYFMAIGHHGS